jgi:RNase P subunit RPR2
MFETSRCRMGSASKPPRRRLCPKCHEIVLAAALSLDRRVDSRWGYPGGWWRRCPACGHRGRTEDFEVALVAEAPPVEVSGKPVHHA